MVIGLCIVEHWCRKCR